MIVGVKDGVLGVALVAALALSLVGCGSVEQQRESIRERLEAPALAVFDLAEAAEGGDITGVRTYADMSAVGLAFARATMARLDSDDETSSASTVVSHGDGFPANAMEMTFAEQFTTAFFDAVESGTVVAEGTVLGAMLESGPGAVQYASDDEALVSVEVPGAEGAAVQTARFRMARTGDRWMLIAVEETTDLYGLFFGTAQ
ncbi:MAG: hypothetical protein VB139_07995 [Coriobacteriia bacterium]|nr:hypothetical protein [Coriobacteriia bacterium]